MTEPIVIIGGGGHSKVLIDVLKLQQKVILGITERPPISTDNCLNGIPIIGNDDSILHYGTSEVSLVNGIGSTGLPVRREEIYIKFHQLGYRFETVQHPSALIASDVQLADGVQIMAGTVLQPGCRIGKNVIINTSASIDHDCEIQDHAHIAPGVTLSGDVRVGTGSHIGTGATIIQGVRLGKKVVVGAGAVVVKDVPDGMVVVGVPARGIK